MWPARDRPSRHSPRRAMGSTPTLPAPPHAAALRDEPEQDLAGEGAVQPAALAADEVSAGSGLERADVAVAGARPVAVAIPAARAPGRDPRAQLRARLQIELGTAAVQRADGRQARERMCGI